GQALRKKLGLRDVAAADLTAARRSVPSRPEAARLYAAGQAHLAHGDAGLAREAFEQSLLAEPEQPMVLAALATAWKALGYGQRERDAARRAFEHASDLPRGLVLVVGARYREALPDWPHAAELWLSLVNFLPDELDYGLSLVENLARSGKTGEALARLDRLRQLAPPSGTDPRIDLGEVDVAAVQGQNDRALAAAARATAAAAARHADRLVAQARERHR